MAKDRDAITDLIIYLQRFAQWAIALQRPDGLWSVFADEPALTPDTAGSAGIAAALALGAKHGWLDDQAKAAARKTLAGLQPHLDLQELAMENISTLSREVSFSPGRPGGVASALKTRMNDRKQKKRAAVPSRCDFDE